MNLTQEEFEHITYVKYQTLQLLYGYAEYCYDICDEINKSPFVLFRLKEWARTLHNSRAALRKADTIINLLRGF